jgi:hypothetical protein
MNHTHTLRRPGGLAVAALLTGVLLAACGSSSTSSSSKTSTSAAAGGSASRTALVACLRKHGVTLRRGAPGGGPPSGAPGTSGGSGGGGFGGFGGGGARRFSGANRGKFQAAFKACGANFPHGGRRFTFSHAAVTKYVTCVRQHGYNLPTPNFSGKGSVFPAGIRSNAKFQKASRACQSLLRPPGAPGAPPGA